VNCLACHRDGITSSPAVAICARCGAGLCDEHLIERSTILVAHAAIARTIPVDPPARRLLCPACAAAEDALRLGRISTNSSKKGS
jgi:hypothetical protein